MMVSLQPIRRLRVINVLFSIILFLFAFALAGVLHPPLVMSGHHGRVQAMHCQARKYSDALFAYGRKKKQWDGQYARRLSPLALMDGEGPPVVRGRMRRLIHQSWKDEHPPRRFEEWSMSWRRQHPSWSYVLWTDADNLELVKRRYPQYLDLFTSLPSEIYRADLSRNFYMHAFGGLYADLDGESLQPIDTLLESYNLDQDPVAFVARLATGQGAIHHSIPNAFMASSAPSHPFWNCPMEFALQHRHDDYSVEMLTGPIPLEHCATMSETASPLVILPPKAIYPYSWDTGSIHARCVCSAQKDTLDTETCKSLWGKDSYAVTYWSHSWGGGNEDVLQGVVGS